MLIYTFFLMFAQGFLYGCSCANIENSFDPTYSENEFPSKKKLLFVS